jgi:hypothetical protein
MLTGISLHAGTTRSFTVKILSFSAVLVGAGLLIAAPAFAQTKPDHQTKPDQMKSAQATSKQKTDGGPSDGGFNTGPASGATSGPSQGANKQHTDGGPSDGGFYTGPASKAIPK